MPRSRLVGGIRLLALLALVAWALATPGFLTPLSLFALLTALSVTGCVAVGMTFITLTGNVLSLALGATLSAASIVFLVAIPLGLVPAMLAAVLFAAVVTGLQGAVIGYLRANAILVSIAALALIEGAAQLATGGQRFSAPFASFAVFRLRPLGLPFATWVLLATVALGQFVQSATRLGRDMVMTGSNRRAAEAAGVNGPAAAIAAYVLAGVCTGIAAIILVARYGAADMELGAGYDTGAIAAVLVGGTAIQGGAGGVWRTLIGVAVISTIEMVLRVRGFSDQVQGVITGLIVLLVIILHAAGERR